MKSWTALSALITAVLIGVLFIQQREVQKLKVAIGTFQQDGGALGAKISQLEQRVTAPRAEVASPLPVAKDLRPAKLAALPTTPEQSEEPPPPGIMRTVPPGWELYQTKPQSHFVGVDRRQIYEGRPSAFVEAISPAVNGTSGMTQTISAEPHWGKRLRFSGWVKTQDSNDGGGRLAFRVVDRQTGAALHYDEMANRPITGTTDWKQYSIVLDVPPNATTLTYGFFLNGAGKMWVNGARIEAVSPEVSPTSVVRSVTGALPPTPLNLGFDPSYSKR